MATLYFVGKSAAVSQVSTVTPAGPVVNDIFNILVGGITIATYTALAAPTVATVTAGLTAAWNASTHPYKTSITAVDTGALVQLTGPAGMLFIVTVSKTGTGTITTATPTVAKGPNDYNTIANWFDAATGLVSAALPVSGDKIIIKDSSVNICWNLDQSAMAGAGFNGFDIRQSYTGRIGLNYAAYALTADGMDTTAAVPEYRENFLKIKCAAIASGIDGVTIGSPDGLSTANGPSRCLLDLGTTATHIVVTKASAASAEAGRPCIRLRCNGTHSIFILSATGGCGVGAEEPNETLVLSNLVVSDISTQSKVVVGGGSVVTTITTYGGTNFINHSSATLTTFNHLGGNTVVNGPFLITTCNASAGNLVLNNANSGGNVVANLNASNNAVVDLSQSPRIRTVTTTTLSGSAKIVSIGSATLGVVNPPTVGRYTLSVNQTA